ncbi:MAG TPA: hypothetical protein PLK19_19025 [Mycobacterium sp.]|nr:hypothetical protein [Mycobacterium sp.]
MRRKARPAGISSRITRSTSEPRHPWISGGVTVDLPVVVDWVNVDPETGAEQVRIEARIDLVDGQPEIVSMSLVSPIGLNLVTLQRDFRWSSPLEVVTGLVPRLIAEGTDPFAVNLPVTDFPAAAIQPVRSRRALSDEFLTTVAREYLVRGRGYAASLAEEYYVSPRTVVSWVEKARARGLLSAPPTRGAAGGRLMQ